MNTLSFCIVRIYVTSTRITLLHSPIPVYVGNSNGRALRLHCWIASVILPVKCAGWIQLASGKQSCFTATWNWKVSELSKSKINLHWVFYPVSLPFLLKESLLVNFLSISFQLDIDECKGSNNVCDDNAYCSNTVGSYNCTCKEGFTGDGHSCSGKKNFQLDSYSHRDLQNVTISMGSFT